MWLDKLEQKWGRYALPHLMRYIIFGNAIVFLVALFYPNIVLYLNLVPALVLRGQIWRLFTFFLVPSMGNPFLTIFSLFCYYWIGESLERTWGSFKFGIYYFIGWLSLVIVMFLVSLTGSTTYALVTAQMSYFNQSMFLALAALYPEMRILVFYFIPLKAKWAGYLSAAFIVVEFFLVSFGLKMLILASFIPFAIFFLPSVIQNIKAGKRRNAFQKNANPYGAPGREAFNQRRTSSGHGSTNGNSGRGLGGFGTNASSRDSQKVTSAGNVTRAAFHRCYTCGITELDDPNMTFRYCSSCNGNYEYCENHIHNHVHVQ